MWRTGEQCPTSTRETTPHHWERGSCFTSSSSSSPLFPLSSAPLITKRIEEKTQNKQQRIAVWVSVCMNAEEHVCEDTGGRTHSECTVYVNHWGDDIQSERWWQPLCLNGNTSFFVSPAPCCSVAPGQFKKDRRRRQEGKKKNERE